MGQCCNNMKISKLSQNNEIRFNNRIIFKVIVQKHVSPGHRAYQLQFAEQHISFDQWDRTLFIVRRSLRSSFDERYLKTVANSDRQSVSVFIIMSAH